MEELIDEVEQAIEAILALFGIETAEDELAASIMEGQYLGG